MLTSEILSFLNANRYLPFFTPHNCVRLSAICFSTSFDEHSLIVLENCILLRCYIISLKLMNKMIIHYLQDIEMQPGILGFASLYEEVCSIISLSNVRFLSQNDKQSAWLHVYKSVKSKQTAISEELPRSVKSEKKVLGRYALQFTPVFITFES